MMKILSLKCMTDENITDKNIKGIQINIPRWRMETGEGKRYKDECNLM